MVAIVARYTCFCVYFGNIGKRSVAMSAEDPPLDLNDPENATEKHSLDELAKGLARGDISRGRALKLLGAAVLGFGSLGLLGGVAEAHHRGRRRHHHRGNSAPPPPQGCNPTSQITCPPGSNASCCFFGDTCCSFGSKASCCPPGELCCDKTPTGCIFNLTPCV
jgi:hypothetical protein